MQVMLESASNGVTSGLCCTCKRGRETERERETKELIIRQYDVRTKNRKKM